ncbi:O-antigen ligase family protein [Paracoccaceae bacterium GXU_MW_L88]
MAVSATSARSATTFAPTRVPLALFAMSFMLPLILDFGGVLMTPTRAILLIFFFPSLYRMLSGKTPPLNITDFFIFFTVCWAGLSYFVNHGASQIQFIGMQFVDLLGAYIFARAHVRSASDFKFFWKMLSVCALFILPVALIELFTDRLIIHEILGKVFRVSRDLTGTTGERLGLDRVQGTMEHPILFGVFWGISFANIFFLDRNAARRTLYVIVICVTVFTSLSSGAFLTVMIQGGLLIWNWISKGNWKPLLIASAVMFVVVEIVSDRSAIAALSTRLAFSAHTAYWRLLIWEHGTTNVMNNPIFGLGLKDWVRPSWMFTASVDNYWLLNAMRNGLPCIIALLAGMFSNVFRLVRLRGLNAWGRDARTGYIIAFVALFIALGTVAVWSASSSYIYFYFGLMAWMFSDQSIYEDGEAEVVEPPRKRGVPEPFAGGAVVARATQRRGMPSDFATATRETVPEENEQFRQDNPLRDKAALKEPPERQRGAPGGAEESRKTIRSAKSPRTARAKSPARGRPKPL